MNYRIKIWGGVTLLIALLFSCEQKPIQNLFRTLSEGAVLRRLDEKNNLERTDGSSTYSIRLEAQTADNGRLLKEVLVSVGFFGDKEDKDRKVEKDTVVPPTLFRTVSAAEFSLRDDSRDNLPEFTFEATLQQLANHVGMPLTNLNYNSIFTVDFEMILTDGRRYNAASASRDIIQSSSTSFFNAQFSYTLNINARETLITTDSLTKKRGGRLHEGETDTLYLTFGNGRELATLPTVVALPSGQVGTPIQKITSTNRFYCAIPYTVPASTTLPSGTVSFVVTQAALYAGLPMKPDTLKNRLVIDNVVDFTTRAGVLIRDRKVVERVTAKIEFGEPLEPLEPLETPDPLDPRKTLFIKRDILKLKISSSSSNMQFDEVSWGQVIAGGETAVSLDFALTLNGNPIEAKGPLSLVLTVTGVQDRARNVINKTNTVVIIE